MARITVEDCLALVGNRFSLVLLAAVRAKQLLGGRTPLTDTKGNKAVVSALREIADGKVMFKPIEPQGSNGSAEFEGVELGSVAPGNFPKVESSTQH